MKFHSENKGYVKFHSETKGYVKFHSETKGHVKFHYEKKGTYTLTLRTKFPSGFTPRDMLVFH